MKRDFAANIATAVTIGALALSALAQSALAQSAPAMPTLASAQDRTMASDPGAFQAHVTGYRANRHGWLTTMGPDAQGRFAVSINIADLDATSATGQAALASRVEWATAILCDMTAPDELQSVGFYDAGARKCRDEMRASALARLSGGQHASILTLGLHTIAR